MTNRPRLLLTFALTSVFALAASPSGVSAEEAPEKESPPAATSPAPSAEGSALLKKGIGAHDALDYRTSVKLLADALKRGLTPAEQVTAYEYLAFDYVGLNRAADAEKSFGQALEIDPKHKLPDGLSPRITTAFERARASAKVTLAPRPVQPEKPFEGDAVTISTEIADPGSRVRAVQLFHRTRGNASEYSSVTATIGDDGVASATVPGTAVVVPGLDYYVVAEGEGGATLAQTGGLAQPLSLEVAPKPVIVTTPTTPTPPPPVVEQKKSRTWLWVTLGVVGAAAVAGGVTAGVLASQPQSVDVIVNSPR